MADALYTVHVRGMDQLLHAFDRLNKDVGTDLVWELEEAADPVRKLTEQIILGGGYGRDALEGMARTPYFAGMRVGVSRREALVYVAPAWAGRKRNRRPNLAGALRRRMETALEAKSDEIVGRVDDLLGRLATEWGRPGLD